MSLLSVSIHPYKGCLPSIAKDVIGHPLGAKGDRAWTQRGWAL